MALKNSEYDAVMRRYDDIQARNRHLEDERRRELYEKLPELQTLNDESASDALEAVRLKIQSPKTDLSSYAKVRRQRSARKKHLLLSAGYPADYLDPLYDCPLCRDTGFIDGRHCSCFDRIAAEIIYGQTQAALLKILQKENFDHFSFAWYSDTIKDDSTGSTPLDDARTAYQCGRSFAENIGAVGNNLYIYGNTGVGKTFLSHCIAGDALTRGLSVIAFSAVELFDRLASFEFGHDFESVPGKDLITDCDLLIVDDLGTELVNAFTASKLFQIIDGRALRNHSTIISTNLSIGELRERYSERIFSRIISHYSILHITGQDIRILQKTREA